MLWVFGCSIILFQSTIILRLEPRTAGVSAAGPEFPAGRSIGGPVECHVRAASRTPEQRFWDAAAVRRLDGCRTQSKSAAASVRNRRQPTESIACAYGRSLPRPGRDRRQIAACECPSGTRERPGCAAQPASVTGRPRRGAWHQAALQKGRISHDADLEHHLDPGRSKGSCAECDAGYAASPTGLVEIYRRRRLMWVRSQRTARVGPFGRWRWARGQAGGGHSAAGRRKRNRCQKAAM